MSEASSENTGRTDEQAAGGTGAARPAGVEPAAALPGPVEAGAAEQAAEVTPQPMTGPELPDPAASSAGAGYRIALEAYAGPLDLLLYLIRKEEVDIYDIPIARIAEQYRRYVEVMAEINVNVAGEFLVMAATLMEIKSRMLLPREEGVAEEEEDPRAELVRQLLEYKRYRDLARELGSRAAEQARMFPRPDSERPAEAEGEPDAELNPLEGIGLWELIDAFAKVLSETTIGGPEARLLQRERPIHEFRRDLLRLVTSEGMVRFSGIFADCKTKLEMIAMFIALLELVRLRCIRLEQSGEFGELYLRPTDRSEPASLADEAAALETPADAVEPRGPESPDETPASPGPQPLSEESAPRGPRGSKTIRPLEGVRTTDVLSEISELSEEEESIGRARERIDAAIARAEAFLRAHHEQAKQEQAAQSADAAVSGSPPQANSPEEPAGAAASPGLPDTAVEGSRPPDDRAADPVPPDAARSNE